MHELGLTEGATSAFEGNRKVLLGIVRRFKKVKRPAHKRTFLLLVLDSVLEIRKI